MQVQGISNNNPIKTYNNIRNWYNSTQANSGRSVTFKQSHSCDETVAGGIETYYKIFGLDSVKEIQGKNPEFFETYYKMFLNENIPSKQRIFNARYIKNAYDLYLKSPYIYALLTHPKLEARYRHPYQTLFHLYNESLESIFEPTEKTPEIVDTLIKIEKELDIKEDVTLPLVILYKRNPDKVVKIMQALKTSDYMTIQYALNGKLSLNI